ncbi:hypothetical protein COU57_04850 [Candidatus Pacearchaeota archaeon CG10_big_fil_rev_8_21_14_0_10_32_14]|nr:MAG: hypothetical protein COU57_04850 [Candidatus Pacearchaeota archaeon CG10_big_fil_rev_8_21_14_0_10_32_14]
MIKQSINKKRNEKFDKFKQGQKMFGDDIAVIINSILLSIVYILGVGATSLFAKITGKKFLNEKIDKEKTSYWEEFNLGVKEKEEYYRQF